MGSDPDTAIQYVQIGAGRLGLGFAYPVLSRQCASSILLQRVSDAPGSVERNDSLETHAGYSVLLGDERAWVDVPDFRLYDSENETHQEYVVDCIVDADVLCVTTGTDVRDLWPLIVEADRRRDKPLAFLVLANADRAASAIMDAVEEETKHEFALTHACDAVTDRICSRFFVHDGVLSVVAEPYYQLVTRCDVRVYPQLTALAAGDTACTVTTSDSEFIAFEKRKAWLMNATHYAYAALGLRRGAHLNLPAAAADDDIDSTVAMMQREFCLALMLHCERSGVSLNADFSLEALGDFCEKVRDRVRTGPEDDADRIFRVLLDYSRVGIMFADVAAEVTKENDKLLHNNLESASVTKMGKQVYLAQVLSHWSSNAHLMYYRQQFTELLGSSMATVISRIGLATFFEKARARMHEPLDIILDAIQGNEKMTGMYPYHATRALLAVEEAVLGYVKRAEHGVTEVF